MISNACTISDPAPLPTPAERPESDVVIYDGDCRICTAQIRKLPWWDCQKKLSYLSLHDPEVARCWPDLSHDRMMQEMVIVDHRGNRHWGPEALRYLTRRLRRLFWATPFMYFPGAMLILRPLYRWIARNRYRLRPYVRRRLVRAAPLTGMHTLNRRCGAGAVYSLSRRNFKRVAS